MHGVVTGTAALFQRDMKDRRSPEHCYISFLLFTFLGG